MLPDGKVRIMAHTDNVEWAGVTILEAPTYMGPYTVKTPDTLDHCGFCEEDPFMVRSLYSIDPFMVSRCKARILYRSFTTDA
jgi:hypothetical protein